MTLKEELKAIDPELVKQVFDEVLPRAELEGDPAEESEFMESEVTRTWVEYPAFHTIYQQMIMLGGRLIAAEQVTEEKLHGMLMGGIIVQQVLSSYAETDVPDTLPPDIDPGNT